MVILSSCLLLNDFKKLQSSKSDQNNALIDDKKQQPYISGDHGPIFIDGNGELDTLCSGMGTDGKSWNTAHRIENYTINGQATDYCIQIQHTDRYLIIRNCTLLNADGLLDGGVDLYNSSNVWIDNCTFINNRNGIYAHPATIELEKNLIISNNNFSNNFNGIWVEFYNDTQIYNNVINGSTNAGLLLFALSNSIIKYNNISNNKYGLSLYDLVLDSKNNTIWMNWLINNSDPQAVDDTSEHNKWDNGTVGNYWGDYQKKYPEATNNGIIWDTPYSISGLANAEDRFPLVIPVKLSINHPNNITYVFGSKGNKITWLIIDSIVSNPTYAIYCNGVELDNKSWSIGDPLIINVDGLGIGVYNYTIVVHDGLGDFVIDQVKVTVVSSPPPPPSGDDDDDDDDDDDNGIIPFGNYYLLFTLLGMIFVLIIFKKQKNIFKAGK